MTAYEALTKKYTLEASLSQMEERYEELKASLPELKYRKREAEVACVEGRGGLQRFLDRLRGKEEVDPETPARAARAAAAALEAVQRELEVTEGKLSGLRKDWEELGDKETLMAELSPEEREHFLRLEASLAAEAALHFLRKARKELAAAQDLARNQRMTVGDGYKKNVQYSSAAEQIEKCREKLGKIQQCGIGIEVHPYLESPMGYLVTAAPYGELDRLNSAMAGIRKTEESLKELLLQLAE